MKTTLSLKPLYLSGIALGTAMLLLAGAILASPASPAIYWHATSNGLPAGADMEALAIAPPLTSTPGLPLTLYAGTWGNGIYRSTDNSATWIAANTGITLPMHVQGALAVDPFSPTIVYAGDYYGFQSGLYRSTNSGDDWSLALPGASVRAIATSPITPGLVLAGDRYTGTYRSLNWGSTWTLISETAGLTDLNVSAIAFGPTAPYTAYLGTAQSVFASGDGGLTWQFKGELPSTVYALAVSPFTPTTLFAGTYNNGVYTSTNEGLAWKAANTGLPPGAWVTSLAFDPFTPTIVYAGTWEGQVYRSENSGEIWTGLGYLGNVYALAVHPTARGVIFAGTSNNGLFRGSTLDHLTIDPIGSPQYVNHSFPITVTARDALDFPLAGVSQAQLSVLAESDPALAETLAAGGYNGTVILTDTAHLITPTVMSLVDGIGSRFIVFSQPIASDIITATLQAEDLQAVSNPFEVKWFAQIYLPIVLN